MRSPRFVSAVLAIDSLIYVICLLGLWQVDQKADLPFRVARPYDGRFRVVSSTGLVSSSIEKGDVVISFGGADIASLEDLEFFLDGKRIDDELPIAVDKRTGVFDIKVRLVHAYSASYVVVAWLVGTLFFVTGIMVFVRRRDDIAAYVYHFGAVAVAVVIMSTWGCYAIRPGGLGQFIRVFFSAGYAFVPALFLHFSLVFPSRRKSILSGYEHLLYFVAILLSLLMGVTFIRATSPFSIGWFQSFMAVFNVTRWFYAACVILSIVIFIRSYRVAKEEMERRKLRWIILGLALSSLGFISLWQIPQLLTSRGLVREEVVVLLSGATPIAFTVAIIRYHVLDIDHVFNRSTVYVMMLVILLSVYALIVGAVAAFVGQLTVPKSIVASAAAAIAVALLFDPLRQRVQTFVDKNFFRVRYDLRRVKGDFAEGLKRCVTVNEVAQLAVNTAASAIPVERIGYFVLDNEGSRIRVMAHQGFDSLESRSAHFDMSKFRNDSLPIAVEGKIEPGVKYDKADAEVFRRWGITIAFAVRTEDGGVLSFLAVGPKKAGTRYSIEDVDLLDYVASNCGLAHERIILYDKLAFEREERERLEELSRMKTYFVSSVSHDLKTPLTTIRMYTEALRDWRELSVHRVRDYLDTIQGESKRLTRLIDNVLDVAKAERTSVVYNMKPEELDGIVGEAIDVMDYEVRKGKCHLKSRLTLRHRKIFADRDAIIEAVGNLIANSIEYSTGKCTIDVRTFSRGGIPCVSVKDSGIGIDKDDLPQVFEPFFRGANSMKVRPGGTGLGLSVVKSVMDAHSGRIEVESKPGLGTKITLLFPCMEEK